MNKKTTNYLPSLPVLDFEITTLSFDEQALLILRWARLRKSKMVCLANVHMLMEAHWSQEFSSVLAKADIVTSDGIPLVWTLKAMGVSTQERVAGMDLFFKLCQLASLSDIGIFFLGSQGEVLNKIKAKLKQEYPSLKISGMEPLPFRPLSESENRALVQKINESGAGIVLVCLGCPKQEYWMAEHLGDVQAVMIGVGAVFPVYAGLQKRAPQLLRENGAEWAYRLIQEPRRLWPRYSQTIPPFLYLATQQVISHLKSQALIQPQFMLGNQVDQDFLNNSRNLDMKPAKIGELLERNYLANKQSISLALTKQKLNPKKLGEILLEDKNIPIPELNYYLANQKTTLSNLLINRKIIPVSKLKGISQNIAIGDDAYLAEFLLEKKVVSESILNILLVEKHLRIKGFWLNPNNIKKPIFSATNNNMSLDIAYQI